MQARMFKSASTEVAVKIHDIETPAVLIETETLHRNLLRMADYCKKQGLALRQHTKTHKIPEIARLQMKIWSARDNGGKACRG